jgi:benzodiazapine receptor
MVKRSIFSSEDIPDITKALGFSGRLKIVIIKSMKNWPKLIFSIFLCQLAGLIGSVFTTPAISSWYTYLNKPNFNPPNWLFAPVWVSLYTLMGISLYLVWQKKNNQAAIKIFLAQLILNSLWSIIFFGLRQPFWAFIEIIFLWSLILLTIFRFQKISKIASLLLIPYLLWVSFASFLNFYIFKLN